jgi:hypothetical protein
MAHVRAGNTQRSDRSDQDKPMRWYVELIILYWRERKTNDCEFSHDVGWRQAISRIHKPNISSAMISSSMCKVTSLLLHRTNSKLSGVVAT